MPVTAFNHAQQPWHEALPVLLASSRAERATGDALFYLGILVVVVLAVVAIGLVVRRLFANPAESLQGGSVFNLSDLRRMHQEGLLSDEEFQAAKAAALAEAGVPQPHRDEGGPGPPPTPRPPAEDDPHLGPELLDGPDPPKQPGESDNKDGEPPENKPGDIV